MFSSVKFSVGNKFVILLADFEWTVCFAALFTAMLNTAKTDACLKERATAFSMIC